MHSTATEMLPGLWLGHMVTLLDHDFLQEKMIQQYLQTGHTVTEHSVQSHIIPLNAQDPPEQVFRMLQQATQWIKDTIVQSNLMVYDVDDNQASFAIIATYITRYGDTPIETALEMIQSKTGVNMDNHPFKGLLKVYEKYLKSDPLKIK